MQHHACPAAITAPVRSPVPAQASRLEGKAEGATSTAEAAAASEASSWSGSCAAVDELHACYATAAAAPGAFSRLPLLLGQGEGQVGCWEHSLSFMEGGSRGRGGEGFCPLPSSKQASYRTPHQPEMRKGISLVCMQPWRGCPGGEGLRGGGQEVGARAGVGFHEGVHSFHCMQASHP